jgi:hypothetical protein
MTTTIRPMITMIAVKNIQRAIRSQGGSEEEAPMRTRKCPNRASKLRPSPTPQVEVLHEGEADTVMTGFWFLRL